MQEHRQPPRTPQGGPCNHKDHESYGSAETPLSPGPPNTTRRGREGQSAWADGNFHCLYNVSADSLVGYGPAGVLHRVGRHGACDTAGLLVPKGTAHAHLNRSRTNLTHWAGSVSHPVGRLYPGCGHAEQNRAKSPLPGLLSVCPKPKLRRVVMSRYALLAYISSLYRC